jgi:hypothetical protein
VPLTRAPFYYCKRGYIRSAEEWERRLRELVTPFCPAPWSLKRFANSRTVEITGMRMITHISPEFGVVGISEDPLEVPLFAGTPAEFFCDEGKWVKYKPELEHPASWHRDSLRCILQKHPSFPIGAFFTDSGRVSLFRDRRGPRTKLFGIAGIWRTSCTTLSSVSI